MTDEELKKKCKERAKIFQQAMESCHSSSPIDCIEWFADRIAELEKENAELKEQCSILADCNTCVSDCKTENIEMKKQLTKAKEIIKYLLSFIQKENYKTRWDINIAEAEQFISEVEK